jgi:nucleotidyltransferase/DNA polymerase involved in DNA repair
MTKTEVYSWRLDPDLKQRLGAAARDEKTSIGGLLNRIVEEWLDRCYPGQDDEALQRQLHEEAKKWIGSISLGEGPYTRERIRERVRARLAEKRKHRGSPPRSH